MVDSAHTCTYGMVCRKHSHAYIIACIYDCMTHCAGRINTSFSDAHLSYIQYVTSCFDTVTGCYIATVEHIFLVSQVLAAFLLRPKHTSKFRRIWNLTHWTLGRAALALAIANIFIGMRLSHLAYKNIIAQAVVLGGLFIIVMLKNDIEYLLVGCTPAEEEAKLRAAYVKGMRHAWPTAALCMHYA